MSDVDSLFMESLLENIRTTTEIQWDKMDRKKIHYFSTPSLKALLTDMEAQVGVHPPTYPAVNTHEDTLGNWVGDISLAELKSRIDALETTHRGLYNNSDPTSMMNAWALSLSIQERCGDLTYLGVYLYGIGVSDGLYRPDSE